MKTYEEHNDEFFLFTKDTRYGKHTLENVSSLPSGLYYAYITLIPHFAYNVVFQNVDTFKTWHACLGHPGIGMMRKIISNSSGHCMSDRKFPKTSDFVCTSCASRKLS